MNSEIIERLNELKKEKNAVILAHIYQLPEIQDIADFVGDSLDLSRKAANTNADVIVFCGVHFMAETAAILSPDKKVIIPDTQAGCPMADMITPEKLADFKKRCGNLKVVSYVNTSAAIKAESDICCTSSNAVEVVKSVDADEIIFVPDRNLGSYVQKKSGKKMILWNGFCPTHNNMMLPENILSAKAEHSGAQVLVHPECRPEVVELADRAFSTGQMCRHVAQSSKKEFIIGTESGILYRLKQDNPDKNFYGVSSLAVCPNMKKITLAKTLDALSNMKNVVTVAKEIREKAYVPIKKMLDVKV
ncbi:MAG: quinolinate synthase NadA [Endomicrobium sp.]|jgi:quinolinate synthase|nr:quinolinate synthase NadA [Endomicrobium sp.]